jgi:hypothetical protein
MGEVRSKDLPTAPPRRGYQFIVRSSPPQGETFASMTGQQGSLTSKLTLLKSMLETDSTLKSISHYDHPTSPTLSTKG